METEPGFLFDALDSLAFIGINGEKYTADTPYDKSRNYYQRAASHSGKRKMV